MDAIIRRPELESISMVLSWLLSVVTVGSRAERKPMHKTAITLTTFSD